MYTSVPHACSIHYEVSCGLNPALLAVGLGVPSRFRDRGPRARRSKKKRVRFVSYLRARGDLEAHPSCFGITETSTFQALSRSGRQVNYKFTLPPPSNTRQPATRAQSCCPDFTFRQEGRWVRGGRGRGGTCHWTTWSAASAASGLALAASRCTWGAPEGRGRRG